MEVLVNIVTFFYILFSGWCFAELSVTIFLDEFDKKDMIRALGKFIVAVITVVIVVWLKAHFK